MSIEQVALSEVMRAASARHASLVPESSGYLVLGVARATAGAPLLIDPGQVLVSTEGTVSLVGPRRLGTPRQAVAAIRALLSTLLDHAAGRMPALSAAAEPREVEVGEIGRLGREVALALVPLNHGAAKRALARLARETMRARDRGLLGAVSEAQAPRPQRSNDAESRMALARGASEAMRSAGRRELPAAAPALPSPACAPAVANTCDATGGSTAPHDGARRTQPLEAPSPDGAESSFVPPCNERATATAHCSAPGHDQSAFTRDAAPDAPAPTDASARPAPPALRSMPDAAPMSAPLEPTDPSLPPFAVELDTTPTTIPAHLADPTPTILEEVQAATREPSAPLPCGACEAERAAAVVPSIMAPSAIASDGGLDIDVHFDDTPMPSGAAEQAGAAQSAALHGPDSATHPSAELLALDDGCAPPPPAPSDAATMRPPDALARATSHAADICPPAPATLPMADDAEEDIPPPAPRRATDPGMGAPPPSATAHEPLTLAARGPRPTAITPPPALVTRQPTLDFADAQRPLHRGVHPKDAAPSAPDERPRGEVRPQQAAPGGRRPASVEALLDRFQERPEALAELARDLRESAGVGYTPPPRALVAAEPHDLDIPDQSPSPSYHSEPPSIRSLHPVPRRSRRWAPMLVALAGLAAMGGTLAARPEIVRDLVDGIRGEDGTRAATTEQCEARVRVRDLPSPHEVLLSLGGSPAELTLPTGVRLELVATAPGRAPERIVVERDARWTDGADRPTLVLRSDLGEASEPSWPVAPRGGSTGGVGPAGTLRWSANDDTELWLVVAAGEGPVEEIALPCTGPARLLVADPEAGSTPRSLTLDDELLRAARQAGPAELSVAH